jgi:hypothetical protein
MIRFGLRALISLLVSALFTVSAFRLSFSHPWLWYPLLPGSALGIAVNRSWPLGQHGYTLGDGLNRFFCWSRSAIGYSTRSCSS